MNEISGQVKSLHIIDTFQETQYTTLIMNATVYSGKVSDEIFIPVPVVRNNTQSELLTLFIYNHERKTHLLISYYICNDALRHLMRTHSLTTMA